MADLAPAPAPQRPRPLPASALDIAGVLTAIVQFTPARKDVVSLLTALPAGMRSPALTALLEHLTGHWQYWPLLYLSNSSKIDASVVAVYSHVTLLSGGCRFLSPPFRQARDYDAKCKAFEDAMHKWASKLTIFDGSDMQAGQHYRIELHRALARCTHLKTANLRTDQPHLLEAVTTPNHRVSKLQLKPRKHATVPALPLVAPLVRWLTSGHARHLSLTRFDLPTDAGLGHALATSPGLSSLDLLSSVSVVSSLAAHDGPLASLTKLHIDGCLHENVARLVALLPLRQMKSLVIQASRVAGTDDPDIGYCFTTALHDLSALEHVALKNLRVWGSDALRPTTAPSSTLRTLEFDDVIMSQASLNTLVRWATSSKRLASVSWKKCAIFGEGIYYAATMLQRCIAAGVRAVAFLNCGISSMGLEAMTETLRATHAPCDFELHLDGNDLDLVAVRALLEAVATCTHVSVRLGRLDVANCPAVAEAVAAGAGYMGPFCDTYLYSPETEEQHARFDEMSVLSM